MCIRDSIYKEFNDVYREAATKVGLSLSGFDILYAICEMGDGCLQRDISQMCCIPKQTVNSSIRKLEQDRYLILEKGKGRDMHIHLTEKGQKLMEEKMCIRDRYISNVTKEHVKGK